MTQHVLHTILARYRGSFLMLWVFSIFFNLLVLTLPLYMLNHVKKEKSIKNYQVRILILVWG